mgnify:CR=1 FL=1
MPHPNAFLHLPELQGRLTPAHDSGLRLTDEALAEWDAQARSQGLAHGQRHFTAPLGSAVAADALQSHR